MAESLVYKAVFKAQQIVADEVDAMRGEVGEWEKSQVKKRAQLAKAEAGLAELNAWLAANAPPPPPPPPPAPPPP